MPKRMGFFTDTTICIGCKACEVACKEWNRLPAAKGGVTEMSGDSYDNTRRLDSMHWRHVKFIEQFSEDRSEARWLMMSDHCKHCVKAACLDACPTGAIIRTEFDTVVIRPDVSVSGRCAMTASATGWSRRAPRPVRRTRSSLDRSANSSRKPKHVLNSCMNKVRRGLICTVQMRRLWEVLTPSTCSSTGWKCMDCPEIRNL
jgi:Fe-S-cluster-containing dehydrogenase component